MKAREKYINIFGEIKTLAAPVAWTTGISNMLEWLLWSTSPILGITKTEYKKKIVEWTHEASRQTEDINLIQQLVTNKIQLAMVSSERENRYDKPSSSITTAREGLRRTKYFSEDYLNKEFDIFWGLVSDQYLTRFYSQFISLKNGGSWFSHGNSGLFSYSTNIAEMQMDNLSYNPAEKILVANELKLNGKKNADQLLKYALMHQLLIDRKFIEADTKFFLLFIGDNLETTPWEVLLEKEIKYCNQSVKSTSKTISSAEIIQIAKNTHYASTTWRDLIQFNEQYISELDIQKQQVEYKLLWGFNQTLSEKGFLNTP